MVRVALKQFCKKQSGRQLNSLKNGAISKNNTSRNNIIIIIFYLFFLVPSVV